MNYKKIEEIDFVNLKVGDKLYCHTDLTMHHGAKEATAGKFYEICLQTKPETKYKEIAYTDDSGDIHYLQLDGINKWFSLPTTVSVPDKHRLHESVKGFTDEQKILYGNWLIAEFAGAKTAEQYTQKEAIPVGLLILIFSDDKDNPCAFPDNIKSHCLSDIKYHCSWDWLMPVIEKIEMMGYKFQICRKRVTVSVDYKNIFIRFFFNLFIKRKTKNDTKLHSAYEAVVQFIAEHESALSS